MLLAECVTDWSMVIQHSDEAFADLLHEPPSALCGRNIYDLTHPDDLKVNRLHLDELRKFGRPFAITKRYVRADGKPIWVNNHVSLVDATNGRAGILATVRQIEPPSDIPAAQRPSATSSADSDLAERYNPTEPVEVPEVHLLAIAQRILAARTRRTRIFGESLFGEPDYEIMLDLFVNEARQRKVSISSACIASGVPPTTALRHISNLVARGWVIRTDDPSDRRCATLSLSADSLAKIRRYLRECGKPT